MEVGVLEEEEEEVGGVEVEEVPSLSEVVAAAVMAEEGWE